MVCYNCGDAQTYSAGKTDIYARNPCLRSYERGSYKVDSQETYRDSTQVGFRRRLYYSYTKPILMIINTTTK